MERFTIAANNLHLNTPGAGFKPTGILQSHSEVSIWYVSFNPFHSDIGFYLFIYTGVCIVVPSYVFVFIIASI